MHYEAKRFFNEPTTRERLDHIRIRIASPEKIRSWSWGEVKKPETINYRTFKVERGGLFCARIFGPVKDYECLCGKYKRMKFKGVTCEKCGVEVTLARVRRERMGHIELAAPVAHIWFLKSLPSRIGTLLDITLRDLERVLYFESHIVTEPGLTPLDTMQLLSEDELAQAQDEYGADSFEAMIGAEAIRTLLMRLDLPKLAESLRQEIAETTTELKPKRLAKRLKVVEAFIRSGNRPEWMILTVLPLSPPDLRPLVPLDGGRFATSDLNDLLRRIIYRNNRLRRLTELRAPEIIVRNEKRMLQEAVDALFDNGRRGRTITATNNRRPLKSLSDMLKGKQGRFRQNLLGKRVDYSGRSVIVAGPELKLHQCGLPKRMALELFKPFIYSRLEARNLSATVKQAKKLVEKEKPEVWDILDEVIREHPVLLNRAPTLHRLGIQAFEPILIEGKAIQLHPLVCTAFNADFDGDQMAVHIPLSLEAQLEARVLMMSTNNILHPANGHPVIVPSEDIVLGLYYLTLAAEGAKGEGMLIGSLQEAESALFFGALTLHTRIKARIKRWRDGAKVSEVVETTPGRMMLGALLPDHEQIDFDLCNLLMTTREVSRMIDYVYRFSGQKETVVFCDQIMALGLRYACLAGISIGKNDMLVPGKKTAIVDATKARVRSFEAQYLEGVMTREEKFNRVIEAWSQCNDKVGAEMMSLMSSVREEDRDEIGRKINAIYMMSHSGARGSPQQMRQLAGMRGLMQKPSGDIIESPIISNFKEGLSVLEYFNSTHGGRKGLADLALKTANSGYLTRRLVDVAQDCIITQEDCGTNDGIRVRAVFEGGQQIDSLSNRVLGRVLAEDVLDEETGKTILKAGTYVEEPEADLIEKSDVDEIKIRSVLTCLSLSGVCAHCYGRDFARGTPVNMGEAVGVVAAQSIGEPGTQLTMRTFHIGGAVTVSEQSFIESSHEGQVRIRNRNVVRNSEGHLIAMGRSMAVQIIDKRGKERISYGVHQGARLFFDDGDQVSRGERLVEWDPYTRPILADCDGLIAYQDLDEGISVSETSDETTGFTSRVVIDWRNTPRAGSFMPRLQVTGKDGKVKKIERGRDARYALDVGTIIMVEPGASVKAGDVIARNQVQGARTRDITGGLPRVAELFEARTPKDPAVIADRSGRIRFGREYKSKQKIYIVPEGDETAAVEYLIPKSGYLNIQEGDEVEKGDFIVDGKPTPHDILAVNGVEALAAYLVDEIQQVYRLQGVVINDKHIEVIVRQMLQKVEITDPGDTAYLNGEQLDRVEYEVIRAKLEKEGKKAPTANPILLGITKASLQTRSFISAASFQETTRVLTEASVSGRIDRLEGLKENVIVGRLVPVGTGAVIASKRSIASERDRMIIEDRLKASQKEQDLMLPQGAEALDRPAESSEVS